MSTRTWSSEDVDDTIVLTPDQANAVQGILDNLEHGEKPSRIVLCGYAGTGKTVTTAALISELRRAGYRVAVATPTHKARAQVERALTESGAGKFEAVTVHRLLGLRQVKNFKTGEETYEPDPKYPNMLQKNEAWSDEFSCKMSIQPIGIVIVDETSMLSRDLYDKLLKDLGKRPVVFVGDDRQLLPVKETEVCAAFTNATSTHRLEKVIRHDGAILNLATATRERCVGRARFTAAEGGGTEVITYESRGKWADALIQMSLEEEAMEDFDFCRALAWTNEAVDDLNERIHKARYGPDALMFKKGMTCVTMDAVPDPEGGAPLLNSTVDVLIEEAEYDQCFTPTYKKEEEPELWNSWIVTVSTSDNSFVKFRVIDKSDQKRWYKWLDTLASEAKKSTDDLERRKRWKYFFARRDSVGFLQPNSAMTIHKSQGSTFKNVFLHWSIDIPKRDQNQLAYVGITRASETLHVLAD